MYLDRLFMDSGKTSREWHNHLHNVLLKIGFEQCVDDPALYLLVKKESFTFLMVNVFEILLFAKEEEIKIYKLVINNLKKGFELRISTNFDKFPGFSFEDNGDTIKLHNKPMVKRF